MKTKKIVHQILRDLLYYFKNGKWYYIEEIMYLEYKRLLEKYCKKCYRVFLKDLEEDSRWKGEKEK